jgi:hypothetical protein
VSGAVVTEGRVNRSQAIAAFEEDGCLSPRPWGNDPGATYGWHEHPYHKVLFCLEGSIVFHTDEGDLELTAGDRLDLEPGTRHSATVGPRGCTCLEAPKP